jgi:hypothetical protein
MKKEYFDVWKCKAAAICYSCLQSRRNIKGYEEQMYNIYHNMMQVCKGVSGWLPAQDLCMKIMLQVLWKRVGKG